MLYETVISVVGPFLNIYWFKHARTKKNTLNLKKYIFFIFFHHKRKNKNEKRKESAINFFFPTMNIVGSTHLLVEIHNSCRSQHLLYHRYENQLNAHHVIIKSVSLFWKSTSIDFVFILLEFAICLSKIRKIKMPSIRQHASWEFF